jgi:hypothetical protein
MTSAPNRIEPAVALAQVDHAILELVRTRRALSHELLGHGGASRQQSIFPRTFRVDEVVELYVQELGPPAELLARSILNVCRPTET